MVTLKDGHHLPEILVQPLWAEGVIREIRAESLDDSSFSFIIKKADSDISDFEKSLKQSAANLKRIIKQSKNERISKS